MLLREARPGVLVRIGLSVSFAIAGALSSTGVLAHDVWLQPERFRLEPGELLQVSLLEGHGARVSREVPRSDRMIDRFVFVPEGQAFDGERALPVLGRNGSTTVGVLRPESVGAHTLVYRGRRLRHQIDADTMLQYAREEGLEEILARHPELHTPAATESYSRCLKALVTVGDAEPADHAQGLPLEIVIERFAPSLRVEVLFEGEPLGGVLVELDSLDTPGSPLGHRTGRDGRAVFGEIAPGPWLLSAVHLFVPEPERGTDWESLWAAVSFSTE